MSYRDKRYDAKKLAKARLQESRKDSSKEQLEKLVKKRFNTVFVGAVVKLEDHFGDLWGEHQELDEEDMTLDQLKWYKKFLDVREQIFDQGNSELKRCLREMDNFDIDYVGNKTTFTKENK